MLPLPTHEPLLEKLDPATLFCILALKNAILVWFQFILISYEFIEHYTDGSGLGSALKELRVWGGKYV